jgi:hypothetical protein
LAKASGRFMLDDVSFGRSMAGVKRGEVKKLLVVESLPKPVNFTGGMDPLSYKGTFTLERALGTVPVDADGSAYFEAPALRSLFFVALDERGRILARPEAFEERGAFGLPGPFALGDRARIGQGLGPGGIRSLGGTGRAGDDGGAQAGHGQPQNRSVAAR